MDIALQADGLGKRYGRNWALRDCTLRLPTGRIAALVGPNGAGKSTLLHLAVGLLQPDAGSVRLLGQNPRNNIEALADVGFVAQDTPLYRDFSPRDLVTLGGKLNRRWDAALARDRLAQLGIPPDRPVGKLSGGQRAQVALALALAKRPRLLLLDEPVASLDPLARREFLQVLMGSVADSGTTVLLSSHLIADVELTCDYLILLRRSRVTLDGLVDDLLATHHLLIGPCDDTPAGVEVIRARHTDRQATLVVRGTLPTLDPAWTARDVSLEELVLAYLTDDAAATAHEAWGVAA